MQDVMCNLYEICNVYVRFHMKRICNMMCMKHAMWNVSVIYHMKCIWDMQKMCMLKYICVCWNVYMQRLCMLKCIKEARESNMSDCKKAQQKHVYAEMYMKCIWNVYVFCMYNVYAEMYMKCRWNVYVFCAFVQSDMWLSRTWFPFLTTWKGTYRRILLCVYVLFTACICVCVCMYFYCVYICVCLLRVYMCVCVCMCVCMYCLLRVYVCVCVYTCICILFW
jgi:hypothetical protein